MIESGVSETQETKYGGRQIIFQREPDLSAQKFAEKIVRVLNARGLEIGGGFIRNWRSYTVGVQEITEGYCLGVKVGKAGGKFDYGREGELQAIVQASPLEPDKNIAVIYLGPKDLVSAVPET